MKKITIEIKSGLVVEFSKDGKRLIEAFFENNNEGLSVYISTLNLGEDNQCIETNL